MPREARPLDRDGGTRVRDASLVVIASEDRYAVPQYFGRISSPFVQIVVLPTLAGDSSPAGVLRRLDEFRQRYSLLPADRLWLCLDTDHWIEPDHVPALHRVLSECHGRGYRVALSRPCFEFWLLLHFTAQPLVSDSTAGKIPLTQPTCFQIETRLREVVGTYNKRRVDLLPLTEERVRAAIERARSEWDAPDGDIPDHPATAVHRILDEIERRGAFAFR